jgi:acyl transferase domain-containing protein
MAAGLYRSRRCSEPSWTAAPRPLLPHLGLDVRSLVFSEAADKAGAEMMLAETGITQPALFAVEYALARLWMAWGVKPAAMIGHSLGEYVAACLAETLSRADAARWWPPEAG